MPQRIQLRRSKGWKKPEGAVVCVRPGILGNPYVHDDPAVAVAAYEAMLDGDFSHVPGLRLAKGRGVSVVGREEARKIREAIAAVRGKDLCCWCRLDAPCHVDVILRRANAHHG